MNEKLLQGYDAGTKTIKIDFQKKQNIMKDNEIFKVNCIFILHNPDILSDHNMVNSEFTETGSQII